MLVATQHLPNPQSPIHTQHLLMSHSVHHDAAQPSTPQHLLLMDTPHVPVVCPTQPHTKRSELPQQALHRYTTSAHCHAMCWQPHKVPRIWCCCQYLPVMQPAAPPTAGTVIWPHHNYNPQTHAAPTVCYSMLHTWCTGWHLAVAAAARVCVAQQPPTTHVNSVLVASPTGAALAG
jgi:hypothetical protein